MPQPLPKYERPPVIETVLGVQFERLVDFSAAHAGWFWREYLGASFDSAKEAARLEDRHERFGEDVRWGPPHGLFIRPGHMPDRIQLINSADDRMVQIQDSRFIYNWRKRDAGYPSFDRLRPEFFEGFANFQALARQAKLGEVEPNQWEVTYLNHLVRGDLWHSLSDLPGIFPGFYVPPGYERGYFESFSHEWHFVIGVDLGRLHVAMSHGRTAVDGPEVIVLTLTARGPVDEQRQYDLSSGIELGHAAIVKAFTAMTSGQAHKHWGRTL